MKEIKFDIKKPINYQVDIFSLKSIEYKNIKFNDLTICTQLTVERLPYLSKLSLQYDGPISVSVYIGNKKKLKKKKRYLNIKFKLKLKKVFKY
jgi:hypothetical protein